MMLLLMTLDLVLATQDVSVEVKQAELEGFCNLRPCEVIELMFETTRIIHVILEAYYFS